MFPAFEDIAFFVQFQFFARILVFSPLVLCKRATTCFWRRFSISHVLSRVKIKKGLCKTGTSQNRTKRDLIVFSLVKASIFQSEKIDAIELSIIIATWIRHEKCWNVVKNMFCWMALESQAKKLDKSACLRAVNLFSAEEGCCQNRLSYRVSN